MSTSTSTARSRRQRTNTKCLGVISLILPTFVIIGNNNSPPASAAAAAVIRSGTAAAAVDEDESENDVGGGGQQQLLLGSNDSLLHHSKIVSLLDWSSREIMSVVATQPKNRIENGQHYLRSSSSMAAAEASSSLGIETNRRRHLYNDHDIEHGNTTRNLRSRPRRGRPKRGERSSSQEEEEHWCE
jgi:hypothetical protein